MRLQEVLGSQADIIPPLPSFNETEYTAPPPSPTHLSARNIKAAGVCLFVVLLAFGLFFNVTQPPVLRAESTG